MVSDLITRLRTEIGSILGVPTAEVDPDIDLGDQGLDSVRLMGLVDRIRAEGHQVDYVDLAEDPRLTAWSALIGDDTGTGG